MNEVNTVTNDDELRELVRRFQDGTDSVDNELDWSTFIALIHSREQQARLVERKVTRKQIQDITGMNGIDRAPIKNMLLRMQTDRIAELQNQRKALS